ncbi:MAG: MBL fold metallo-hydrolase [Candidatus Thorarchaeota archaeon]|jgi:putative mRNA 3-end processing factor
MNTSKLKLPNPRNKTISKIFSDAKKNADLAIKSDTTPEGFCNFGESNELIVFEIAKQSGKTLECLPKALSTNTKLQELFLDSLEDISLEDYLECATLALYGYALGNYDDEDFRYVYRYSLKKIRDKTAVEKWLRKAMVFLAAIKYDKGREILSDVRSQIRFLGSPMCSPSDLLEACSEFGIDIEGILNEEDYRLVHTLRRYSSYLKEALEGKEYEEVRKASSEWLPDVLSSRILGVYRKQMYKQSQDQITSEMSVAEAVQKVGKLFEKEGFQSESGKAFPIRLQELPNPPPADAVDPIIFEMIPQKLRINLLSSVAYSTKTKTVEIIFLGGPRIGRSGILIKTDTGGILLDYGLSVANQRIPEWIPELEMIDTVLISHSHLDHVGGLPILYENYSGKWCSTGETGAVSMVLLEDALKVGTPLMPRKRDRWDLVSRFTQSNIDKVSKNHVKLEVGKSNEVGPGIVVTPIDACHIPGSTSFLVDVEGVKILYTGDFNLDKSALFPGANLPTDCDAVIFDGTYWSRDDFDRQKVSQKISDIVDSKGPVIIPTFAVGRSQEMLVILDELGITKKRNVMVAGMAERVTKLVGIKGHWEGMKKNKTDLNKEDILVAGGGMMGGGLARHYFNEHRNNPDAAVILCGYLAPRSPGWNLINGHDSHICHVDYARISAHSSASNLQQFVKSISGKKIMVHTPYIGSQKGLIIPDLTSRIVIPTK